MTNEAIDWEGTAMDYTSFENGVATLHFDRLPNPEELADRWRTLALAERERAEKLDRVARRLAKQLLYIGSDHEPLAEAVDLLVLTTPSEP